jgi:hypothetical protein
LAVDRRALLGAFRLRDDPRRRRRNRRLEAARPGRADGPRLRSLRAGRRQPRPPARRDPRHLRHLWSRQGDTDQLSRHRHLGAWLEQLLAESTGKHGKGVVPVDREPLGVPEVYRDDRLFVYLRLAADDDTEQNAKVATLERAGQPVVRIVLEDVADLGGEFFRWEFATAVAGSIIGIDPFDQPDVEEAKTATRKLTDAYDESGSLPELHWLYDDEGFRLYADERNARELQETAGDARSLGGFLAVQLSNVGPGDYLALLATCR